MMIPGMVTVVVPCFNAGEYLGDAFLSLRNQTYSTLEIIAIDDGSTDETLCRLAKQAADDPRIHIITQPNRGPSAARNAGLRQARGEFVCFLDADDVLLPDKTEKQVRYLRENPAIDLVYSDYFIADSGLQLTGLNAARIPAGDLRDAYACKNWFAPMTPLARRPLIETVGEFDESLRASEDWDYWIRCANAGVFGYLPGPVAIYRTHPSQAHNDGSKMFDGGKRVINKHFRSDPRQYRRAMAAFYEFYAKYAWGARNRLKAGIYVAISVYHDKMGGLYQTWSRGSKPPVDSQMKTA